MAAVLGLPIEQSRERAVQVLEAPGPDRGYLYFLLLGSRLLKQGSIPGATGGTAS
jgi:hypothetical protein